MKRTFTFLMSLFLVVGTMVMAAPTDLPMMTESPDAPVWYTIKNTRSGKYVNYAGDAIEMTQVAAPGLSSLFYFTASDAETASGFTPVMIHNAATANLLSDFASWTAEGKAWFISVGTDGLHFTNAAKHEGWNAFNDGSGANITYYSANDAGSYFVVDVVDDLDAYLADVKVAAIAELNKLQAALPAIYPDATELIAEIEALKVVGTAYVSAIETVENYVSDYKEQALEGKYFTIQCIARGNTYMQLNNEKVVGVTDTQNPATIWQFKYVNGVMKVFNPSTEKYLCEPGGNSEEVAVTTNASEAGSYQLVVVDNATNPAANVKLTANGKSVHMSGGWVLVRWDNGAESEWAIAEVEVDVTKDITDCLEANVENHAELPAIGQYTTAGYNALQTAKETVTTFKQAADAIAAFEATKNLPYFIIEGAGTDASNKAIYDDPENKNDKGNTHYFKEIDTTDETMLWVLDMTETVVGVTEAVGIKNLGTGAGFWGCPTIKITETEPSDLEDGIFLFYTTDNGTPIHAQGTGQLITRWGDKAANSGSAWKFTFVGMTNPAAYDLSEVAAIFQEKAVTFAGLQANAALSALGAVQNQWVETMGVVEPLFGQIGEGALVLKADVEAAIEQMDAITAVVDFYSGEAFTAALDKAGAALDELDEESDAYAALLAAKNVSTVTTVAQLEAKITEIDEIIAALEPEADPNDYTSYIKNADLSTSFAEEDVPNTTVWADWNLANSKGIKKGYARISGKVFDFSQTITLPAGQYKMTAKAAYRFGGSEQDEYNSIEAGDETHLAKLYAQTSSYKYEVNVMNRYEGASDTDLAGSGAVEVNGKFVPNSSDAVKAWFDADQYVNVLVFNVQTEGEVKIGIAKTETASDYTNIGAWTLTRLGDAEADPQPEYTEEDYDLDAPAYTDVTAQYIKNAAMSANIDGWTSVGGGTAYEAAVYEFYAGWGAVDNKSGSLTQSVTLPAGTYRLTGKAFYRAGATYNTKPGVSLGYLVAGNNKVLVKTLGSIEGLGAYADNRPQASTAFYTDGLYDNVLDFVLEEETTLNIGYECTHEDVKSWFIVGAVKLESVQAVPGALVPLFEAQAMEFCQYSSEAMSSLPAVSKNWEDLCGRVFEIYEAISNEEKVLDKVVRGVMDEMTAMTAELAAIEKAYATFNAAKLAIYAIQENSTPNNDDVKAAFDAAVEEACNVSTVTTPAELNSKVAEMEAARQVYVMNAVPAEGYPFDMTFKVSTSKDAWVGNNGGPVNFEGGVQMPEKYETTTATLGEVMSQTVTGLPDGQYTVELWANARYTSGRGFESSATDGQNDFTYLFANQVELSIPVVYNSAANGNTSHVLEGVYVVDGSLKMGMTKKAAGSNWHTIQIKSLNLVSELPDELLLPAKKELFTTMATEFIPAVEAFTLYMIAQNELQPTYELVGNMNVEEATLDELEEAIAAMVAANAIMDEANAIYAEYSVFVNYFMEASEYSEPLTAEAAELLQNNMSGTGAMMANSVAELANRLEYIKEDYITYITNAKTYDGYMFDVTFLVANAEVTSGEGWSGNNERFVHTTEYEGAPDKTAFDAGWWATNINIYQELPELPAGDYKLSAIARSNSAESYIYAKIGETEVKATLPQNGGEGGAFGNGWDNVSTEIFSVAEGESLTIGVYVNNPGEQFAAADNFKLYYGGSTAEPEPEIEVTLNKWVYKFDGVGAKFQLEATITPEDVEGIEIVWSSSDDLVATVDQNGLVTAVGKGDAEIIATVNGVEYTCMVEVLSNDPTGIENIDAEVETVIYDLSGRRVQKMEKGIYIVNGKKVVVK